MYNKNNNGPSIEPCGISHTIFLDDDVWPLTEHTCFLFVEYNSNHFSSVLWIPNWSLSFLNKISWLIESKVLHISRKTTPFSLPLSMSVNHWSHIWISALTVPYFDRNPDWNFDIREFSLRYLYIWLKTSLSNTLLIIGRIDIGR